MFYYLWIFAWLLFIGYVESHSRCYQKEFVPGLEGPQLRLEPWMAFIIILPMILWAGYRDFWFADTGPYYWAFRNYSTTWNGFIDYLSTIQKDIGFYSVSAFLKLFITNPRIYLLILAFFQGICLMKFFRRFSNHYVIGIFLFVASTDIFSWMFNGLRQFTAVSITLLAASYIVNKKYFQAIVIVVIASLFHQSALLMLPMIFIVQGKAWNWKTMLFLFGAIVAIAFIGQFTNLLDAALENTQYTNIVSDYTSWEDDGTNPIRVLIYAMPTILAFLGQRKIREDGGVLINLCVNMSVVSTGLYLISMVTSGIFLGRLPIYFSLYNYVLLPWEIDILFKSKYMQFVKYAMIFAYLGFYCYQRFFAW